MWCVELAWLAASLSKLVHFSQFRIKHFNTMFITMTHKDTAILADLKTIEGHICIWQKFHRIASFHWDHAVLCVLKHLTFCLVWYINAARLGVCDNTSREPGQLMSTYRCANSITPLERCYLLTIPLDSQSANFCIVWAKTTVLLEAIWLQLLILATWLPLCYENIKSELWNPRVTFTGLSPSSNPPCIGSYQPFSRQVSLECLPDPPLPVYLWWEDWQWLWPEAAELLRALTLHGTAFNQTSHWWPTQTERRGRTSRCLMG